MEYSETEERANIYSHLQLPQFSFDRVSFSKISPGTSASTRHTQNIQQIPYRTNVLVSFFILP